MKAIMVSLILALTIYIGYRYIRTLIKLRKASILPATMEEAAAIRRFPTKIVDFPTYAKQKVGIISHAAVLLFVALVLSFTRLIPETSGAFLLMLIVPLFQTLNFFNLFSIIEDGLLCGSRFVPWRSIQSFYFIPVNIKHRFYGFSEEVNQGYELKIKTTGFTISCFITTDEMKERLTASLKGRSILEETYTMEEMY